MAATTKTAARSSSGLSYPDRFYAAALYVGFGRSPDAPSTGDVSRFQNDVALLLYGLYQQATVGPCNVVKPSAWNPVEHSKWTSWNGLGNMASMEAMRLFVKILEEEDPAWYSRVPELTKEPVMDVEMHKANVEPVLESIVPSGDSLPLSKTISTENEVVLETHDKDIIVEGLGSVVIYDQWIAPSLSGQLPRPRYAHGAAVLEDKMYIFGGNHNGRYLNDLQVLDLKNLTWSRLEAEVHAEPYESSTMQPVAPCAGHTLISWNNKILCVGGHTKDPSETLSVKELDPQTGLWSNLKIYGKPPISRGGQSVTVVGNTLVIFGGEDARRSLLNDLDILDLETMTWDDLDAIGTPPSPRSDHVAACHADRYLLVFGGGSHATCFNDLHVLDLQTMEWSRPKQQGVTPGPRAGHAGVTIGDNWFITGGGNNMDGLSETLMLNMSTLFWSVVTTVEERAPIASEGLTLVTTTYNGEDFLVSFGGYNGRYSNQVYVLKPSYKSEIQSKIIDGPVSDSVVAMVPAANADRDVEPETEVAEDKRTKEITVDNDDLGYVNGRSEQVLAALKAEKEELEATVNKEKMQNLQIKQEIAEAESRNAELTKELQSVRSQLASEQSRCFKLEVDLAELRQKLQNVETLQKEFELLQKQKAASEQAALSARQRQGSGVWGWLAGSPTETDSG